MEDQELTRRLAALEAQLKEVSETMRALKRYALIYVGVLVATMVLPLIGLAVVIPNILSLYSSVL